MTRKKWIPLAAYNYISQDHVVFARMRTNGLIDFKTKRINSWSLSVMGWGETNMARELPLDIKKQWEEVVHE